VIRPSDWLAGDDDGVVVVPADKLGQTIHAAQQIIAAEKRIERAIRRGQDLGRLLRTQEIIERKQSDIFIPQLRASRGDASDKT
jgi:regulator of RNase E activity RraA